MCDVQDEQLTSLFFDVFSGFMLKLKKSAVLDAEWRMNSHTFFILFTLGRAGQNPISMTQLAEELQISKQQLTKLVNDLETKLYVERVHDQVNRRLVYIHITPEGRDRLRAFALQALQPVREALEASSQEEKEQLRKSFQGMIQFLQKIQEPGQ